MIHYLVTAAHVYTMHSFLSTWGAALAPRISIATYDYALSGALAPCGGDVCIFSDLDRIGRHAPPSPLRLRLGELRRRLEAACGTTRVLNDPMRSILRYDLLRALRARGTNAFGARRAGEPLGRFPVFLRRESGYAAEDLPLLRDERAYRDALDRLRANGAPLEDMVAVEYCDTADDAGIFRKYGAFVVGARIVPRHLFFSRRWLIRTADLSDPALLDEELAYLGSNPHAGALAEVARLAGVAYGRIDYSLLDGAPQIWEINTNPMLASQISARIPQRREATLRFVQQFSEAITALERAT